MKALVKHAWPLWVAGPTPLTPTSASLGEGGAELALQGLFIPLSFCQFEVYSHLLCEEKLSVGPEAWGMQGSVGEKGGVCMGKHTSTCKNMFPLREMCPGPMGKQVPRQYRDAHSSALAPWQEFCICHLWKARPIQENMLHLSCARGADHASPGLMGVGRGAVISSILPRHHPRLFGGQGSLHVNTPLPGSPWGGGREGMGEGMREHDSGLQIPAEIL